MKIRNYAFIPAFGLMMLVGCGDDAATTPAANQAPAGQKVKTVASYENLPVCSDANAGTSMRVKDENSIYLCDGEDWVLNEETSSSSTAKSSSSVESDEDDDWDIPSIEVPDMNGCSGGYSTGDIKTEDDGATTTIFLCSDGTWLPISQSANSTTPPAVDPGASAPVLCAGGAIEGATMTQTDGTYNYSYECHAGSWYLLSQTPVTTTPSTPVVTPTSSATTPVIKSSSSVAVTIPTTPSSTVSSTRCGNMFCGPMGDHTVATGFGEYGEGYWFDYSDNANGGKSSISWPAKKGGLYDMTGTALDYIIDAASAVSGTFTLNKGTITGYNPFVGVGFTLDDEMGIHNVTSWGGLCFVYSSDKAITVELSMGDDVDYEIDYNSPAVTLPASTTPVMKSFTWTSFKQQWTPEYTFQAYSGSAAASQLFQVKFKIQAVSGSTGKFAIYSVGSAGSCS